MARTYGSLKEHVLGYLNYDDDSVADNIEHFIRLAYDNVNSALRIPTTEEIIYHDVTTLLASFPIPNNFQALKRMYYGDTKETLSQIDIETLNREQYAQADWSNDSRPIKFARNGNAWVFNRPPVIGTRIVIVYHKNIDYPVDDTDTDDFLDQTYTALMYRAIAEGYRFLEDLEAADYYIHQAVNELTLIQEHADTAEVVGSVITQCQNPWY